MKENYDLNAKKALDELKMEIAKDLDIELTHAGMVGGLMTKKLVEIGQKELIKNDDTNTFNPS